LGRTDPPHERLIRFQELVIRKWGWIVTFAALAAAPASAQTAFPDLRGTWKGESESIITDSGNPHHSGPPQSEPRLTSVPFTLTIDKQDGRRVSGTFSSPRSSESIIGVITRAGTLLLVDIDGYASGSLLGPNRLEMCYLQIATYGRVVLLRQ
jgi:hypothetical protein